MQTLEVASWDAFEEQLERIKLQLASHSDRSPALLFRGQSNSEWSLETTLERRVSRSLSFSEYYRLIRIVQPEIEAFTGARWELPTVGEAKWLTADNDFELAISFVQSPAYSYMTHLRHHGFPSPFLDWTRSPHVAGFFAFHPTWRRTKTSVYVFCEMPEDGKSGWGGNPSIVSFGPTVRTHRRHFLQQAEYTICVRPEGGEWRFVPHEEVIRNSDGHQDVLWKIDIPATERVKVLKLFDSYNLNAYSLFQSEESLMETLAVREFDFSDDFRR